MGKIGRPLRKDFIRVIMNLDDKELYNAAKIARELSKNKKKRNYWRVRLSKWIGDHLDPKESAGVVRIGGRNYPAWHGRLIKNKICQEDIMKCSYSPKRDNIIFRRIATFFLIVFLGSVGLITAKNGNIVYEIYHTQGLKAATNYITNLNGKSNWHLYTLAFDKTRNRKLNEAETLVSELWEKSPNQKLQGYLFYLQAYIEDGKQNYELAEALLDEGEKVFRFLDDADRLGDIYFLRAKIQDQMGEFEFSRENIDKGLACYQKVGNKRSYGNMLRLKVRNYIQTHKLESALNCALSILDYVRPEEKENMAKTYSRLAYVYGLNNNLYKCWEYTILAESIINELGDNKLYRYNLLNYLLIGICDETFPVDVIKDKVMQYIQAADGGDPELEYFLNFTLNRTCE